MKFEDYSFLGLSPNQFYILKYLLENKNFDFRFPDSDLEHLEEEKYIKVTNQGIYLRQKTLNLFNRKDNIDYDKFWDEFVDMYPKKSGIRRLHDKKNYCKLKYLKLIKKDPELHDKIIRGLEVEIKERKKATIKGEFMPDWKMMSSYINQEAWNTYLEDIPNDSEVDWRDDKI